jgi:hypothetical protein
MSVSMSSSIAHLDEPFVCGVAMAVGLQPIISTTCRSRATSSPSALASEVATGRTCGLILRNDLGVDGVGFGELTERPGEASDLSRVDDGEQKTGAGEGSVHRRLEAAGGFEHDQRHL